MANPNLNINLATVNPVAFGSITNKTNPNNNVNLQFQGELRFNF